MFEVELGSCNQPLLPPPEVQMETEVLLLTMAEVPSHHPEPALLKGVGYFISPLQAHPVRHRCGPHFRDGKTEAEGREGPELQRGGPGDWM